MSQHILVVEDYAGVREVIEDILVDQGYRVSGVANGQGMRAAVGRDTVHLILLDVGLPGETSSDLAAFAEARRIPVLLMSGYPEKVQQLRADGVQCLLKPFKIRTLVSAVEAALSGDPRAGSARASFDCSSD